MNNDVICFNWFIKLVKIDGVKLRLVIILVFKILDMFFIILLFILILKFKVFCFDFWFFFVVVEWVVDLLLVELFGCFFFEVVVSLKEGLSFDIVIIWGLMFFSGVGNVSVICGFEVVFDNLEFSVLLVKESNMVFF